jgi:group I intron endonuclease
MAQNPIFGEVYVATSPSDKSYVGQTTQGSVKRWKDHVRHSRLANHPDFRYPFACALRKHGADAFQTQVLSIARNKEELDNLEKIWIILLNTREAGYNITAGGEGHPMPHTPESIAKMSANRKGKCMGNKNAAVARTPEFKAHVSLIHRGRKKPEGFGEKIRQARTGVKRPDVTAANNRRWAAVRAAKAVQHGS